MRAGIDDPSAPPTAAEMAVFLAAVHPVVLGVLEASWFSSGCWQRSLTTQMLVTVELQQLCDHIGRPPDHMWPAMVEWVSNTDVGLLFMRTATQKAWRPQPLNWGPVSAHHHRLQHSKVLVRGVHGVGYGPGDGICRYCFAPSATPCACQCHTRLPMAAALLCVHVLRFRWLRRVVGL